MEKIIGFVLLLFLIVKVEAQEGVLRDTITKSAKIKYQLNNNQLILEPVTPELVQIAGAPKAYYSHFWEFGDGYFSKEKLPKHTYKEKGDYEVKLWVTNHYDAGKPPKARPQKVSVSSVSKSTAIIASMEEDLELEINRDPVPEEEMVLVMRYKNPKKYVANGSLYLFYNEKKYKDDNFIVTDIRAYNGEELVFNDEKTVSYTDHIDDNAILYSSLTSESELFEEQDSTKVDLEKTIVESKAYYKNWSIFNFDHHDSGKERNLFFTLKTTPEMLKDTSATISIRGVYVPDRDYQNHIVKEKEMEIVTSHDPNKMSSNGTILNYRLVRNKTLQYKIQFQNDGEGPATTIRLETDIPKMLDKSTIEVIDMSPKCKICPKEPVNYSCLDTTFTKEQAVFTFKNIYLSGTNQKGVYDKDSTKGFVKYKVKFSKDFHKKKTVSQTAIIFDKNDPIITNRSTTRFLPGLSIGAKAGYNMYANLNNSKNYFVGATVSPYKSYRWYWQAELLAGVHNYSTGENVIGTNVEDLAIDIQSVSVMKNDISYDNIDIEIPVLCRYNLNDYIGLGIGVQGKISLKEQFKTDLVTDNYTRDFEGVDTFVDSEIKTSNTTESFTNFRKGLLLDVTGGFARIGPSLGARYVLHTEKESNYWQFYAIWKF